jgi:hypothetical protein
MIMNNATELIDAPSLRDDLVKVSREEFGVTAGGEQIDLFTLANDHGMEVKIINLGGIITAIKVPDRTAKLTCYGADTLGVVLKILRRAGRTICKSNCRESLF